MADFNKKNWLSAGESGATDDNSVINKANMNDLENRIYNVANAINQEMSTNVSNLVSKKDFNSTISNLLNKNGDGLNLTYKNATMLSGYFSAGTCQYLKIGNLVIIALNDLVFAKDITENHIPIITGLPKPQEVFYFMLFNNDGTSCRLRLTTSGNLETHYSTFNQGSSGHELYGYAVYLSSE